MGLKQRTIREKLIEDFYRQSMAASLHYSILVLILYFIPFFQPATTIFNSLVFAIVFVNIFKFFLAFSKIKAIESITDFHLKLHLSIVLLNAVVLATFFSYLFWQFEINDQKFWLLLLCIFVINTASSFSVVISPKTIVSYLTILGLSPFIVLIVKSFLLKHQIENVFLIILAFSFFYYIFLLIRASAHQKMVKSLYQLELNFYKQEALTKEAMKLASVGEMAGGIAHEINNPLMIIQLSLKKTLLLLESERNENENLNEEIKRRIGKAFNASRRIEGIIHSIKMYALSRFDKENKMKKVDIGEIVNRTLDICREQLSVLGISVEFISSGSNLNVLGSDSDLSQVFYHLLSNALDAVDDVEKPKISIHAIEEQSKIIIKIKDNGAGIPNLIREKAFLPFFTTKSTSLHHGVGLASCLSIITSHEGEIWISSSPKEIGTEITFWLKKV